MHFKKEDVPVRPGNDGAFRSIKAGEMEIGFTTVDRPIDCTPLYKGLPGDVCPCDHYGYVFNGSIRARYADGSEEVIGPGCVYWIPKGHVLIYDEPTVHLEINPHRQLDQLMSVVDRNVAALRDSPAIPK